LALRARQRAKLIIARPDFQKDVGEIRSRFRILPAGLKHDITSLNWHDNFLQSDDEYFDTVFLERQKEITKLKKEKRHKEAYTLWKELNNTAPVNAFRIAVKKLLVTYKVPLRWEESIRRYIFEALRSPCVQFGWPFTKNVELQCVSSPRSARLAAPARRPHPPRLRNCRLEQSR